MYLNVSQFDYLMDLICQCNGLREVWIRTWIRLGVSKCRWIRHVPAVPSSLNQLALAYVTSQP
jgi:hypothetical protein